MRRDFTQAFDRWLQPHNRRLLRARDLPLALGPHYLHRLFDFVRPALVVDVGANEGQYARMLRRDVGYEGPIMSVEPIPRTARALALEAQADPQWTVHELALGRERGHAVFNVMQGSEFSSLRRPDAAYDGAFGGQHHVAQQIDVEVTTLDDLLQRHAAPQRPVFVKLDTQGTELDVLAGATRSLAFVDALQVELSFTPIYEGAPRFDEVVAALRDSGYEPCAIFPNNAGHFPRLIEVDALFVRRALMSAALY